MRIYNYTYPIFSILLFLSACSTFDPAEPESFDTFKAVLGGYGYDLILDVIERPEAYVVVGATGPRCDIVDAFMAEIDKRNGVVLSTRTFGDDNPGFEDNFFAVDFFQNKLHAVGFSVKRLPPIGNQFFCSRPAGNFGNITYGTLDPNFDSPTFQYFDKDSLNYDSGLDIGQTDDNAILIAGTWGGLISVIELKDTSVANVYSSIYAGSGNNHLLIHDNGRIFTVGSFIEGPLFNKPNLYFAEVDRVNNTLIGKREFSFNADWEKSFVEAIVQMPSGNILLAGYLKNGDAWNPPVKEQIFIMELDQDGNECMLNDTLGYSDFDQIQDMIKVKDGYVLVGSVFNTDPNLGSTPNKDILILKIDEAGQVVWDELIDYREGSTDNAFSIIETNDGGLLIGGQTINEIPRVLRSLVIKTDARGKIEE